MNWKIVTNLLSLRNFIFVSVTIRRAFILKLKYVRLSWFVLLDCLPRYLQMHISSSPKNEKKIIKRNPVLAGKIFEGAEAYTLWLFYNIMGWIQSGKVMRTVCCSSHLGGRVSVRGVSACRGCLPGGCLPRGCTPPPPCGQNSWHTLMKTLPCRNFVCGR